MSLKQTNLSIVVMGMDKDGKPRAVAYPTEMAEVAVRAASDWKLRVGKAENDAGLALAKNLPQGNLFPSDKMEPPAIKRETYNLLLKTIKLDSETSSPPETKSGGKYVDPWSLIVKGTTVLATENAAEGYFYCTVVSVAADRLTLRWTGYPKLPSFQVKRNEVGLIGVVK